MSHRTRTRSSLVLSALLAISLIPISSASAHGWLEDWISFDYVSGGVQGHGGATTEGSHHKYQVAVRVKRCAPRSECNFAVDSSGMLYYVNGGRVTVLAKDRKVCYRPGYSDLHGGYTCETKTPVRSARGGYCWATVTNRIWNVSNDLAHKGNWMSGLNNCS